jgi:hypothetical protein
LFSRAAKHFGIGEQEQLTLTEKFCNWQAKATQIKILAIANKINSN